MIRLTRVTISGFRGARYPLSIDFDKPCRSIAIFGENATGKSSITDGIEWFFRDKVKHLWREDCKEEALRNVHLKETDKALVRLEFNNKDLSCEKRLSENGKTDESNASLAFKAYKATTTEERIVLRTADLSEFINKQKGEKRKELADIIGYEAVIDFRGLIQKALNSLQNDPDYSHAKLNQESAKSKLLKLGGALLLRPKELFAKVHALVNPFLPKAKIIDDKSYQECIETLKAKIGNKEQAEKQVQLAELKKACETLTLCIKAAALSGANFLKSYNKLIADKAKLQSIDLEQFLSKGRDVLNKGLVESNRCPFCGSKVDIDHLKEELVKRIEKLGSIRNDIEDCKDLKASWISDLMEIKSHATSIEHKWTGLTVDAALATLINSTPKDVTDFVKVLENRFESYQQILIDKKTAEKSKQLITYLKARMEKADQEIKTLELTGEEQTILNTVQALTDLKAAFDEYHANAKVKDAFERQIKTLAKIKEEFIKVQNEAFQHVLDLMSKDISRYYLYLHPKENVDNIKLRIVGEEGIEFEYSFYGRTTSPPMKYLSESHLNSLGLSLFLASVKLFNKESNFFVLDDVVTSFDVGHRLRLLRLLKEEFEDWQILLLTHERHWFEIIKRELGAQGWLIRQVDWSEDNGAQLKDSPESLLALISLKRSQGHDVSNDIRKLLEEVLKEICHSLEVRIAFRYNNTNEERTAGELLNELRGTLNAKCSSLKADPVLNQIETANYLGTKGSHDRPKETSPGDLDVALEDIIKLERLFRCEDKCRQLVSVGHYIESEKKITCKCGKKQIAWKG